MNRRTAVRNVARNTALDDLGVIVKNDQVPAEDRAIARRVLLGRRFPNR